MGFILSLVFGFISLHHRCTQGPPTPFHISTLLCHFSSSLRTVAKRKSAASVHPFLRGRYAWMGKVRSNMITLPKSNILHPVYFITNLFLIIIITTIIMMTIFFVIVFILVEHGCRSFRRLLIIIITITTIVNIIALSTAGLLLYKSWLKTKWGRNSSAIHFGNVLNCISSNLSHLIIFHQQESGKKTSNCGFSLGMRMHAHHYHNFHGLLKRLTQTSCPFGWGMGIFLGVCRDKSYVNVMTWHGHLCENGWTSTMCTVVSLKDRTPLFMPGASLPYWFLLPNMCVGVLLRVVW